MEGNLFIFYESQLIPAARYPYSPKFRQSEILEQIIIAIAPVFSNGFLKWEYL